VRFEHAPDGSWYAAIMDMYIDVDLVTGDRGELRVVPEVEEFLLKQTIGSWDIDNLNAMLGIFFRDERDLIYFKLRFYEGRSYT
jgi:hypothetical protein